MTSKRHFEKVQPCSSQLHEQGPLEKRRSTDSWDAFVEHMDGGCMADTDGLMEIKEEAFCEPKNNGSNGEEEIWQYREELDVNEISDEIKEEEFDEVEENAFCDYDTNEEDGDGMDPLMPFENENDPLMPVAGHDHELQMDTKFPIHSDKTFAPQTQALQSSSIGSSLTKTKFRAYTNIPSQANTSEIPLVESIVPASDQTVGCVNSFPPQIHIPEIVAVRLMRPAQDGENAVAPPSLGKHKFQAHALDSFPPQISIHEKTLNCENSAPPVSIHQNQKPGTSREGKIPRSKPPSSTPGTRKLSTEDTLPNPWQQLSAPGNPLQSATASNKNSPAIIPSQDPASTSVNHACCAINTLLIHKFTGNDWTHLERVHIILHDGQPTPKFKGRYPEDNRYKVFRWLSGCKKLKKYVCWPCLLFSTKGVWSIGYDNKNFKKEAEKHGNSGTHMENNECLKSWKKANHLRQTQIGESLILKLVAKEFLLWNDTDREEVLKGGKPIPTSESTKNYINSPRLKREAESRPADHFQCFKSIPWLTGCVVLNSTYCWPCLLFNPTSAKLGIPLYNELQNTKFVPLDTGAKEHGRLKLHMKAYLRLRVRERELRETLELPRAKVMNKKVLKNRMFMKYFIEAICTRKKQISNHKSSTEEYMGILKILASYNKPLEDFLHDEYESIDDTEMYDRVLSSIGHVMMAEIKKEVSASKYISCIIDSTSVPNKNLFSVVVRFADTKGDVQERFVGFLVKATVRPRCWVMPLVYNIDTIIIHQLNAREKLVGFTYDGAFFEPKLIPMVNAEIRGKYPRAKFFHYKGHRWEVLLQQTLSELECCKDFFRDLGELAKFLTDTEGVIKKLIAIDQKIHDTLEEHWDFATGFIVTLRTRFGSILTLLEKIVGEPKNWRVKTVYLANYFLEFLRPLHSRFLVVLIAEIHEILEPLSKEMETEWAAGSHGDGQRCVIRLNELSVGFEGLHKTASHPTLECRALNITKNIWTKYQIPYTTLKSQFDTIIEVTNHLIKNREVQMTKNYFIANQLLAQKPAVTDKHLREDLTNLADVTNVLPSRLDLGSLMTELDVLHSDKLFSGNVSYIKLMHEYRMENVTPELYRLLEFISAIPMKVSDRNVKAPAVDRMGRYAHCNRDTNFLDALMWMEKDLLSNLQENAQFYESVIDHLANSSPAIGVELK